MSTAYAFSGCNSVPHCLAQANDSALKSSFVVHFLSLLAFVNAFYTFFRKRHYRLFEASIDAPPSTPSARRVRVDSSPLSSSPLRFLSNIIASTSAEARAHPDANRDVWELAVWDPTPLCLRVFCLFSPGHVLMYWLFLPVTALDPRPSVTVITTIILGILLSVQLSMLQSSFSQQAKDAALIHKEVLHEYDTKFVHPSLNRPVRDVATQTLPAVPLHSTHDRSTGPIRTTEVDTYTPTTVINRGFRINPNPAYAAQYDPENVTKIQQQGPSRFSSTSVFRTPVNSYDYSTSASAANGHDSSPIRPATAIRQPRFTSTSRDDGSTGMNGDGGSLGVYTHAASPLRKAVSMNHLRTSETGSGDIKRRREGSPLKRISTPGTLDMSSSTLQSRFQQLKGESTARRESGQF